MRRVLAVMSITAIITSGCSLIRLAGPDPTPLAPGDVTTIHVVSLPELLTERTFDLTGGRYQVTWDTTCNWVSVNWAPDNADPATGVRQATEVFNTAPEVRKGRVWVELPPGPGHFSTGYSCFPETDRFTLDVEIAP